MRKIDLELAIVYQNDTAYFHRLMLECMDESKNAESEESKQFWLNSAVGHQIAKAEAYLMQRHRMNPVNYDEWGYFGPRKYDDVSYFLDPDSIH